MLAIADRPQAAKTSFRQRRKLYLFDNKNSLPQSTELVYWHYLTLAFRLNATPQAVATTLPSIVNGSGTGRATLI